MSSAYEELIWEINDALEPYYEPFDNLFDAAEALLAQFLEEEAADEDDEEDDDDEFSDGSYHEEPAQPMTDLDRELQIAERELQNWEEEEKEAV